MFALTIGVKCIRIRQRNVCSMFYVGVVYMKNRGLIKKSKLQLDLMITSLAHYIVKEKGSNLSALIDNFHGFASIKTRDGQWLKTNDYGLNLFRLKGTCFREQKKDTQSTKFTDFFHECLYCCKESDEEAWRSKKAIHTSEMLPKIDGTFDIFNTIKIPIFNSNGMRKFMLVLAQKKEE